MLRVLFTLKGKQKLKGAQGLKEAFFRIIPKNMNLKPH